MDLWEEESPAVTLIKEFYREYSLEKWNNDRVGRLCQKLRCSLYELCALAGIFHRRRAKAFWAKNRWPPEVAIQFAKLERFIHERTFLTPQPPSPDDAMAAFLISRAEETNHD